jgi:pantoate--beta-alanine ligase
MIKLISTPIEWSHLNLKNKTIGFVPTMGALHDGHASLIRAAREENEIVVVSIFVNPTQFNNESDLKNYPITLEKDIDLLNGLDVDYLFYPKFDDMYPDSYAYKISESQLSQRLCGGDRPGHFDGVLTIVMKLFNIIKPSKVYFGEKDYQQMTLIKNMIDAFFMNITLVAVATIREEDGLAMSSRNIRLSPVARAKAPLLYKAIKSKKTNEMIKHELEAEGFTVNYIEDLGNRRFIAATIENVRLIDNVSK